MSNRIQNIVIENFRGSTNSFKIEFDDKKQVVLIFGENGSGKSTIVDAIDFVYNLHPGSIEFVSATHKMTALPSIGKVNNDIKVIVKQNNKEYKANLRGGKIIQNCPEQPPKAFILRRSNIINIITAQPKERYTALESFFSLNLYEFAEENLSKSFNSAKKKYEESVLAYNQASDELKKLWELEGKHAKNYLNWATEQNKFDSKLLEQKIKYHSELINKTADYQNSYLSYIAAKNDLKNLEIELNKSKEIFQKKQKEFLKDSDLLINTLEEAKKYIEKNSSDNICPVCEQPIVSRDILDNINSRLSSMSEIIKARNDVKAIELNYEKTAILYKDQLNKFHDKILILASVIVSNPNEIKSDQSEIFSSILNDIEIEEIIEIGIGLKTDIDNLHDNSSASLTEFQKQLGRLNSIKNHLRSINDYQSNGRKLELITQKFRNTIELFANTRKSYVNNMLKEISSEVQNLYSKIHPSEKIGIINFSIKENVKASLELSGQFENISNIQPQIYYSESHLDTLGLCIFLALAKRESNSDSIVILDDVISSVDQEHLNRIIEMLSEEYSHFNQLIITTHYRVWRDYYKRFTMLGQVDLIELGKWSIKNGIKHFKTKNNIEELKIRLKDEPIDRQLIASKTGIILEAILDDLALKYEEKFPRRAIPKYTLGDYISYMPKLFDVLKTETPKDNFIIKDIINKIKPYLVIRNEEGCHYNVFGAEINDEEIVDFCKLSIELIEALICQSCGIIPNIDNGNEWVCKCGNKKLHPLKRK